jgi:hypothetical protein
MKVSNEFVEIYKNFNVFNQVENMKRLEKLELYLLLTFCLDRHQEEDKVVIHNLKPFKEECMLIYDLQDDKEIDNPYMKELVELTGDKYINTDTIVDSDGNKLPEPLTKEEVRDAKINIINK